YKQMDKISKDYILDIHEKLLSVENSIINKNISLSDLCKISEYFQNIESRIYLIQYHSIEAAENGLKKMPDRENAYKVFSNLRMSTNKAICSKANYFLEHCYENGFGCKSNKEFALSYLGYAKKVGGLDDDLLKIAENKIKKLRKTRSVGTK
ncbi:1062_t:CDS:1, partial [Dentiscutata heterogama]